MNTLTETLEYIINAIFPEEHNITITSREESGTTILEITAPAELVGQIIGKQGHIIKSIRTLLNISHPQDRFLIDVKG